MNNKPSGIGGCFAVGCSIIGVFVLIGILSAIGMSGLIPFLLIAGGVVAVIVLRNRANKPTNSVGNVYDPSAYQRPPVAPAPQLSVYGTPMVESAPPTSQQGEFATSICIHTFTAADLRGKETVVCPCGYEFEVAKLKEYSRLRKLVVETQNQLDKVWRDLQTVKNKPRVSRFEEDYVKPAPAVAASRATTSQPVPQPATKVEQPVYVPTATIAPKVQPVAPKPVLKRKRATVSAQQWLIFAASFLVIVAGSVFVSTNVANGADPSFYLLATVPFGLATGFMAFWGRKISVILSNFMATFASTMLLATLVPISLLLNLGIEGGQWFDFPSYVWATNLLITSAVSFVLSRFKGNFGWKIYSLLAFVVSMLLYMFGAIRNFIEANPGQFGWFAAVATAAGVVLALLNKALRSYTYDLAKVEKEDLEYEKDLVKREDLALERFTRLATFVFGILGIGYTIYSFLISFSAVEPISFSVFALVWIAAGAIQKVWIDGLASDEKVQVEINRWVHIVGFTTLALALNSWFRNQSLWIGLSSTIVLSFVAVGLGAKVKRVSDHPIAIRAAHFALPISWLAWYIANNRDNIDGRELLLAGGILLITFAMSLMLQHWFKFSSFASYAGTVSHVLGLGMLAYSIKTTPNLDINEISYAFEALVLILLAVLYSPLAALISKRHKVDTPANWHNIVLVLTGVLSLALITPNGAPLPFLSNLISMLGVSALVVGVLGQLAKGAFADFGGLLKRYGYVFQGLTVFSLLISKNLTDGELNPIWISLLALAAVNYLLSFLGRDKIAVQLGYGMAIVGSLISLFAIKDVAPTVHLALTMLIVACTNTLQFFVARRASARFFTPLFVISSLVFTIASLAIQYRNYTSESDWWIGLGELVLVALISSLLAERKNFNGLILRLNAMAYLAISYLTFAWWQGEADPVFKKLLVSGLFAAVVFRQLVTVSKEKNTTATRGWFLLSYIGPVLFALSLTRYLVINAPLDEPWIEGYALPLALSLSIPSFFNRSIEKGKRALTALDIPYLVLMGGQFFIGIAVMAGFGNQPFEMGLLRTTGALGLIAIFSYWRSMAEKKVGWVRVGFVTGGIGGLGLAHYTQTVLIKSPNVPELYTGLLSASIVVGFFFLAKRVELSKLTKQLIAIDLPLLVPVIGAVLYGIAQSDIDRVTIGFVLLAALSYWRCIAEDRKIWIVAGYLSSGASALAIAYEIQSKALGNVVYPELYTVLLSVSLFLSSIFLIKKVEISERQRQLARLDVPILLPVVVSAFYSLGKDLSIFENLARLTLSLVLFTVYSHFKLNKNKVTVWVVATYLGLVGSFVSSAALANMNIAGLDRIPEIFSVAIAIAVFLGNMEVKRVFDFKTSLVNVGLPLAALTLPSVFVAYRSISAEYIPVEDLSRLLLVLAVALVATVWGMKSGNLGAAVSGGLALALVVIPIVWTQAGNASDVSTQVSLRALVISALLFVLFGLLRRYDKGPNTSYVYVGIPVAVGLVPALYYSLLALNNPGLTSVDWTRFGIIVTVSLVLLIVGSLRELGGMFFPGIVGVLVGVLPYAFKPVVGEAWFLWVILLVIAGIMVWIAVRLEQMKKVGKSSVSWVKALK